MNAATITPFLGFASLFRMALAGEDLMPVRAELILRAQQDPSDANALWDLSMLLQLTGNHDLGLEVQSQALHEGRHYHVPASAEPTRVRLLAIMSPGDLMANTPIECLLDGTDVALDMIYVDATHPLPETVPDHDVLMVCVGENDDNRPVLDRLSDDLREWPKPVVNFPEAILVLSRDGVCARLQDAPGVAMPVTARIGRNVVEAVADGRRTLASVLPNDTFPIIIRPANSHAGTGLQKMDGVEDLRAYLSVQPETEFCLTPFVDYRGADGLFRKYRVSLIDGRPFLSHLAISAHWMIHYLNAGMAESPEKRAEEARVMASFDHNFARRHQDAFHAIGSRIGLDYFSVDCGETPDGRLLIFEADNSMVVHAMDPVDLYPYKVPQMRKVFTAFRDMLVSRM
ncbi:MAG: RimK family alpha-L-glutamate ligase [Acidobacteriota bacterium]